MKRLLVALAGLAALSAVALAQPYPINTPFYTPNPVLPQTSFTAAGTLVFQLNSVSVLTVLVAGSGTGIVAEMDGSNDRSDNINPPTWTQMSCEKSSALPGTGNGQLNPSITTNGLYRCDVAGYTQARFNLTALSGGTVTVSMAGTTNTGYWRDRANYDTAALPNVSGSATAPLTPGTYQSPDQYNVGGSGVQCTWTETSSSGSPNAIFSIQSKDAASTTYQNLVSATIGTNAQTTLAVYPGMAVSSLPTGWTAQNLHLTKVWRVQVIVGGTNGPAMNAVVGCNVLD
jgi:hypothetical protein